jgi:hypothetical protein
MPINYDTKLDRNLKYDSQLRILAAKAFDIGRYYCDTVPDNIDPNTLIVYIPVLHDFRKECRNANALALKKINELSKVISDLSAYSVALKNNRLVQNGKYFLTLYNAGTKIEQIADYILSLLMG